MADWRFAAISGYLTWTTIDSPDEEQYLFSELSPTLIVGHQEQGDVFPVDYIKLSSVQAVHQRDAVTLELRKNDGSDAHCLVAPTAAEASKWAEVIQLAISENNSGDQTSTSATPTPTPVVPENAANLREASPLQQPTSSAASMEPRPPLQSPGADEPAPVRDLAAMAAKADNESSSAAVAAASAANLRRDVSDQQASNVPQPKTIYSVGVEDEAQKAAQTAPAADRYAPNQWSSAADERDPHNETQPRLESSDARYESEQFGSRSSSAAARLVTPRDMNTTQSRPQQPSGWDSPQIVSAAAQQRQPAATASASAPDRQDSVRPHTIGESTSRLQDIIQQQSQQPQQSGIHRGQSNAGAPGVRTTTTTTHEEFRQSFFGPMNESIYSNPASSHEKARQWLAGNNIGGGAGDRMDGGADLQGGVTSASSFNNNNNNNNASGRFGNGMFVGGAATGGGSRVPAGTVQTPRGPATNNGIATDWPRPQSIGNAADAYPAGSGSMGTAQSASAGQGPLNSQNWRGPSDLRQRIGLDATTPLRGAQYNASTMGGTPANASTAFAGQQTPMTGAYAADGSEPSATRPADRAETGPAAQTPGLRKRSGMFVHVPNNQPANRNLAPNVSAMWKEWTAPNGDLYVYHEPTHTTQRRLQGAEEFETLVEGTGEIPDEDMATHPYFDEMVDTSCDMNGNLVRNVQNYGAVRGGASVVNASADVYRADNVVSPRGQYSPTRKSRVSNLVPPPRQSQCGYEGRRVHQLILNNATPDGDSEITHQVQSLATQNMLWDPRTGRTMDPSGNDGNGALLAGQQPGGPSTLFRQWEHVRQVLMKGRYFMKHALRTTTTSYRFVFLTGDNAYVVCVPTSEVMLNVEDGGPRTFNTVMDTVQYYGRDARAIACNTITRVSLGTEEEFVIRRKGISPECTFCIVSQTHAFMLQCATPREAKYFADAWTFFLYHSKPLNPAQSKTPQMRRPVNHGLRTALAF